MKCQHQSNVCRAVACHDLPARSMHLPKRIEGGGEGGRKGCGVGGEVKGGMREYSRASVTEDDSMIGSALHILQGWCIQLGGAFGTDSRASVTDNGTMTGSALIFSTGMHRWSIWYGQCGCVRIHLLAAMLQRRLGCRTRWLLLDCSRCSTAQSTAASKSSLFFSM